MKVDKKLITDALYVYRNKAVQTAQSAGYAGRMDDGGASHMEAQADAYEAGLNGTLPKFLKDTYEDIQKRQDPEYAEYIRLQTKFEK